MKWLSSYKRVLLLVVFIVHFTLIFFPIYWFLLLPKELRDWDSAWFFGYLSVMFAVWKTTFISAYLFIRKHNLLNVKYPSDFRLSIIRTSDAQAAQNVPSSMFQTCTTSTLKNSDQSPPQSYHPSVKQSNSYTNMDVLQDCDFASIYAMSIARSSHVSVDETVFQSSSRTTTSTFKNSNQLPPPPPALPPSPTLPPPPTLPSLPDNPSVEEPNCYINMDFLQNEISALNCIQGELANFTKPINQL